MSKQKQKQKTAPKASKSKAAKARCAHSDSIQFTGAHARWCGNCGSAQFASGTKAEPGPTRWHKPKVLDKRAKRRVATAAPAKRASKELIAKSSLAPKKLRKRAEAQSNVALTADSPALQ